MFDKVRKIPNKIKLNSTYFYAIVNDRVPFLLHECKKRKQKILSRVHCRPRLTYFLIAVPFAQRSKN